MCRPIATSALLRNAGDASRKASAGSTAGRAKAKDAVDMGQGLQKTKLCKFFLSGRCRRGHACTFAHGKDALQPQPDLFKTQFCFQYLKTGMCSYGESCSFAHSNKELRSLAPEVASNGDVDDISDEELSLESNLEGLQNEVARLCSPSGAFEGDKYGDHASKGGSDCFSGVVASAFHSTGMCQTVAYFGLASTPSAASMAAQTFVPIAAFMPVAQENSAPIFAVGHEPVGQCEWSVMPQPALCSALSRQATETLSSSASLGFIEEDDGWTSAASISAGSLEEDSQAENHVEVEAAIVVENTFITLKPVSDSMTRSESARVRSASAPPLNRRS